MKFSSSSIRKLITTSVTTIALFVGVTNTVHAVALTPTGTTVTNTATVNFKVSGVTQDAATGSDSFTVDTRVDLNITKNTDDNAFPNQAEQAIKFTVTNDGNDTFDYQMSIVEDAGNPQALAAVAIFQDDGTTAGTFDDSSAGSPDTALPSNIVENLAPGSSVVLYIVSTMPLTAADAETYVVHLKGVAMTSAGGVLTEDSDGDTAGGAAEIVFADAAGTAPGDTTWDKTHSDSGTYTILGASLTVTKTSAITTDGAGGTYHIPGATVEYTIDISNTGSQDATNVVFTDTVPSDLSYIANSITLGGVAQTDAADSPGTDETTYTSGTKLITINLGTITAAGSASQIKFQATIN